MALADARRLVVARFRGNGPTARRVAAHETRSQYHEQQREQERPIDGRAEMAECHRYAPEDDRVATAESSIADQPAQYRCEVDQSYVKAKGLRGESVNRDRSYVTSGRSTGR
jgi:hypothetical protein